MRGRSDDGRTTSAIELARATVSRVVTVVLLSTGAFGCSVDVRAEAEVRPEEVVVRVATVPSGSVSAGGFEVVAGPDGRAELRIPAIALPVGPQALAVDVRGTRGRTGRAVVVFVRPKVPMRLEVEGSPDLDGFGGYCNAPPCTGKPLVVSSKGALFVRWSAPLGSVLRVGNHTTPRSSSRAHTFVVDVSREVLALDAALFERADSLEPRDLGKTTIDLSFRLETADGDVREQAIRLYVSETELFAEALAEVATTPVRIGDDVRRPGPSRLVYRPRLAKFVGKGTLADVDLVAIEEITKKRLRKSCGVAFVHYPRHGFVTADIYDVDDAVFVYERRTGKLVATHTFAGTSDCPPEIPQKEPPPQDATIALWLAGLP